MKAFSAGRGLSTNPSRTTTRSTPRSDRNRAAAGADPLLTNLSHWMDTKFRLPILGWRFGLDSILGLIPGVGDTATSLMSLFLLSLAAKSGVPRITMVRMGCNVALDYIIGAIPLVGDLFDVWFKSNSRNLKLLQDRQAMLTSTEREQLRGRRTDWAFVLLIMGVLLALLVGAVIVSGYLLLMAFEAIGRLF